MHDDARASSIARLRLCAAWAVIGVILASCGPSVPAGHFPGAVAFVNQSRTAIFVSRLQGFQEDPACGNLMVQGVGVTVLGAMPFPREVHIVWRDLRDPTEAPRYESVSLAGVRVPEEGEELIFVFGLDRHWSVETGEVYAWLRARRATEGSRR